MRVWEIREGRDHDRYGDYDRYDHRIGMRDHEKTEKEIYECGFEDGYEKAIEEMSKDKVDYRSSYRMSHRGR